jgi:hypothetical protein
MCDPIQIQMNAVHSIMFLLSVIQQSKLDLGFHMAQVTRLHTVRHIHPVRLLCASDQTFCRGHYLHNT